MPTRPPSQPPATKNFRSARAQASSPHTGPVAKRQAPRNASLTPCRKIAQVILARVAEDAAHASPLLDAAITRQDLSAQDAAWLTELVYGTLRHGAQLESRLQRHLRAPFARLPAPVQCALRAAAYQILHMRVPAYTAVDATVEMLRRRFGKLGGVANAVLRRLAEEEGDVAAKATALAEEEATDAAQDVGPQGPQRPVGAPAAARMPAAVDAKRWARETSHPAWLIGRWLKSYGPEETWAMLQANNVRPPLSLRVNTRRTTPSQLLAQLQAAGIDAWQSPALAEGLLLRRAGEVRRLPGYIEGHFVVQDMAPALVGHMLEVAPDSTVLDLCAAPGGKATHVAELMEGRGRVLAVDCHPGRLGLVVRNATRLGHGNVVPILADACNPADLGQALGEARLHGPANYVLLDPPCSGSGTLRRHPELRERGGDGLDVLLQQQAQLLRTAADLTAPGGRLVYAVCSVLEEEGALQVAAFLRAHPNFQLRPLPAALAAYAHPNEDALLTLPHRHDLDGFYAACLQRSA